jgi:tetratricopeptide (TPR) repeat protein
LLVQRERLAELALGALARLLAHERKAGRLDAAVQVGLKLLALDPLQEPAHRALMQLYVDLGRRAAALRQYETCVGLLQRDLGVEPEPETRALYQAIVTPAPADPARSSTPAWPRGGAPVESWPERALETSPVIGRATEAGLLGEALDQTFGGRGAVVAVLGEAGIGKSRLVASLAAEAVKRGARVLLGRAYESEQVLPFAPWADALRPDRVARDDDALADLTTHQRSALGRLAPELGPPDGDTPSAEIDYRHVFEAVLQLAAAIAARRPLVLILEDMQWADDMSLRLFSFIARRTHGRVPLLVVLTARQEELDAAPLLPRLLEDLDHELPLLHLALSPLSREETTELVAVLSRARLDRADLARLAEGIWTATSGNPFMVVETLQAVHEGSLLDANAEMPLPERVRRLIGRRLDRLAPVARQLVATAAVIGRDFTFPLLQRASGLAEAEAVTGLEEVVRRRLLSGTGERLDFTHDRIREVAADALLPPRRRWLHRQIAHVLESLHASNLPAQSAALGHHYAEAEVWDRAAAYLDAAGLHAMDRAAYREGLVALRRALDAVMRLPTGLATTELETDIRLHLLRLLHTLGDVDAMAEHIRHIEPLIAALGDPRREAYARIHACDYLRGTRQHKAAMASGRAGLALAEALGDRALQEVAHFKVGCCHLFQNDYEPALEHLQAAVTTGSTSAPERLVLPYLPAASQLAYCLAELGRYEEAWPLVNEAMRLGETRAPHSVLAPWALGALCLHQGRFEDAIRPLEQALELCREQRFALFLPLTIAQLALALAHGGRTADAGALLDESAARPVVADVPLHEARVLGTLAGAALALGRAEDARRLAERALEVAMSFGERGNEAEARTVLGAIGASWAVPDRCAEAEQHLRAALEIAEALGMRPLAAHARFYLGVLLERVGGLAAGHAELLEAIARYRAMDMRFWLEKAEREAATSEAGRATRSPRTGSA